jgi:hypothetical protein
MINQPSGAVFVGTLVFEKADSVDGDAVLYTNSTGVATAGFTDGARSGEIAIPAATAGQVMALEVSAARYMTMRCLGVHLGRGRRRAARLDAALDPSG